MKQFDVRPSIKDDCIAALKLMAGAVEEWLDQPNDQNDVDGMTALNQIIIALTTLTEGMQ